MTNKEIQELMAPTPEQAKYGPLFDLVKPKDNWKNAINAIVDPARLEALGATKEDLADSVTFYTGSKATIRRTRDGKFRVTAAGYYAAVGA